MMSNILLRTTMASLLTFATLTACTTPKQPEKPMKWMEQTQTLCIGRFVLNMPADFSVYRQRYNYNGDDIETTHKVKLHMFNHAVQEREKELMDNKREKDSRFAMLPTNIPWLEKALSPQPNSRLLIYRETDSADGGRPRMLTTEGYVWDSDTQFLFKSGAGGDKITNAITDETKKFSQVRARPNDVIPTEPGYCFDGGIMVGGSRFYESAQVYYERPDTPGSVVFAIEMRPTHDLDKTRLLDRVPFLLQMMGNLLNHTKTLRRRDRPLAGLDGQEMLTRLDVDGITAYYFIWEAQGKRSKEHDLESTLHPNTHIELRIGGEPNKHSHKRESTEVSEEEALALWDAMLNSLHVRPGAI